MASLTATTSQDCQGTQGRILLTAVSDAPGAPQDGQTVYSWSILADDGTDYGAQFDPSLLPLAVGVPTGHYRVRVSATYSDGSTANTGLRTYDVDCSGSTGGGGGGGTTPPGGGGGGTSPMYGCTDQRALNYDPDATQDTSPTACEYVQVGTLPQLVAAHLPLPVIVRASPTSDLRAALVVLHLATAPALAGPWVEFASCAQLCDDTATASFNLSEYAKLLFPRILPPVELGEDPGLSALLQVSYEVQDAATGATLYPAGVVGTCRVLNAVLVPSEGQQLTTPTPYTQQPATAALWASVVTLAGGVVASSRGLPTTSCQWREFVWLNATGAFDQGFFSGRHQHGTDQADAVSFRDAAGSDRYARRGTVRPTLLVYSDKVDFATYQLLRGIRQSAQVYERLGPGQYVPVLVSSESYSEYQEQTDKTFQVNFTVSYPAQLIQTQ